MAASMSAKSGLTTWNRANNSTFRRATAASTCNLRVTVTKYSLEDLHRNDAGSFPPIFCNELERTPLLARGRLIIRINRDVGAGRKLRALMNLFALEAPTAGVPLTREALELLDAALGSSPPARLCR